MLTNSSIIDRSTRSEKTLPRIVLQSLSSKQQIINELIEGRLEFLEAASRFQVVHHVTAACFENATGVSAAVADSENLCRMVIGWVYLALSNRPEEAERVSNRLEGELQGYLDRFGKVSLLPQ